MLIYQYLVVSKETILDFELKTTSIYGLINNDRNLILEEYNNHLGGENNEK